MDRRNFIKTTAVAGIMPLGIGSCSAQDSEMSCFIFSDAHIGWKGTAQPTTETQEKMIQVIKQNFPALDLVFDTGDVHHVDVYDEERRLAREFWLQKMAGQFYESRFHYVPGNHELDRGRYDAEVTAGQLGSFNFRPYYSFDFKGIHFISIPQLLDTIYITRETLNWLQQDLIFNADKTTLIFSHNSLKGTTYTNQETGYRETVNSHEVMEIIDSHKHVLGWFHGHNHQYEIVKKQNRLYVSNGRIGGFNPPNSWGPFGQGHLGGIHIKINHKGLVVKAFSATEGKFMDQLGWPNLSSELVVDTSYDPNGKFNYYYGHGKLINGVKHQLSSHYLSKKETEVLVATNGDNIVNENFKLKNPSKFFFAGKETNRLMGFRVIPRKTTFETKDLGLEINLEEMVKINLPNWGLDKNRYMARSGYYRCAAGQTLRLRIEYGQLNGSERVSYMYKLFNRSHDTLLETDYVDIGSSDNVGQANIKIPENFEGYLDTERLYIVLTLKIFGSNKALILKSVELSQVMIEDDPQSSILKINKKNIEFDAVGHTKIHSIDLFDKGSSEVVLTKGKNNHVIIFKVPDVSWQIRNAIASLIENKIIIHKLRSDFQTNKEIIFTPNMKIDNYIAKTQFLSEFEVVNNYKILELNVLGELNSQSQVLLKARNKIKSIIGGQLLQNDDNSLFRISLTKRQLVIELE